MRAARLHAYDQPLRVDTVPEPEIKGHHDVIVRIGGEEWSARAFFEEQTLEPGARVEVAKIEGATALVFE